MSMMNSPARPGGVTLVGILTILSGVVDILGGVVIFLNRDNATVQANTGLDASGILVGSLFYIGFGLFVVVMGRALMAGSNVARFLVTVVMVLRILGLVFGVGRFAGLQLGQLVVQALLAVLILVLLYTPAARSFFRANRLT